MDGDQLPDWVRDLHSALDERMGLEVLEVGAERVTVRIPVQGNTQVTGVLHGGANGVLVETAGSLAATAHARGGGMVAVGTELSVSHHRAGTGRWAVATATALHLGSSSTCHEVVVRDEQGRWLATGRLSCRLLELRGR